MNINSIKIAINIIKKLDKNNKQYIYYFIILSIFSSLIEFIAIGSLYPFILFITDRDNQKLEILFNFFHKLNINDKANIIISILVLSNLISGILKIIVLKFSTLISYKIGININKLLLNEFLFLDYEEFIQKNKENYIELFTNKISIIVNNFFFAIFSIMNCIISIVTILILLLVINTKATIIAFITLSFIYLIIAYYTKSINLRNGKIIHDETKKILTILSVVINNIREIIISSTQQKYINELINKDKEIKSSHSNLVLVSQSPKFIIESIGISIIGIISLFIFGNENKFIDYLPFLAVLVLSAQKMLPSFQLLYLYHSLINSVSISAKELDEILSRSNNIHKYVSENKLNFKNKIQFNNVYFKYKFSNQYTLENINIVINKGDKVGIYGESGSGKSTFIDLVSGLLRPSSGTILVDNVILNDSNVNSWMNNISIVSQESFLINATILENICFNTYNVIDNNILNQSVRLSSLSNFIENSQNGLNTLIVDNGNALSGGQKQRICIARALYRNKDILILDEATSALDKKTSLYIINSILTEYNSKTIIIISHDKELLSNCNKIFNLNHIN